MKTITTPVLRRFGFRTVLIVNGLISAVLILSFGLLSPQTPRFILVAVLFRTLEGFRVFDSIFIMTKGAQNTE